MSELKTLKDLNIGIIQGNINVGGELNKNARYILEDKLKQLAISHIKHMRREGRDLYFANIDEKSAIPKLMEIFNLNEEDLK